MLKSEQDIIDFVQGSGYMMQALKIAAELNLPGWFIGAGFIRNTVWDIQHGFRPAYNFNDLDLCYYKQEGASEEEDELLGHRLSEKLPLKWEVVNQAYAHTYNNVPPYSSSVDGLAHWVETATCVAVTLNTQGKVEIIAPWGVDDLLGLQLRINPYQKGNAYYEKLFLDRVHKKGWLERWPKLRLVK